MTVLSQTAFTVLLWGAILAVALVFLYEVYAMAGDLGLHSSGRTGRG